MKGRNALESEGMRKTQAYQADLARLFASLPAQMVATIRRESVIDAGLGPLRISVPSVVKGGLGSCIPGFGFRGSGVGYWVLF